MMWIPPNLYPLLDRLRTLADRSPHNGALKAQDDQGAPLLAELPIDALRRGLDAIGFELIDLRQEPREGRGAAIGTRKVTKCTALLWHQTAALVSLHQATGIPAHALILERAVVLLHPLRAYVQHAGAGNAFTIGIEIRCRAAGIEGDMRTLWRSPREIEAGTKAIDLVHEATGDQLEAGRLLGSYYVRETARQGGKIRASMYHRNTSESRVSDPGSRIAWGVGLPVAQLHGLQHGGPVVGGGKPTPTCWGGELAVPYNWRVRGY
jgi:hypothetical protein